MSLGAPQSPSIRSDIRFGPCRIDVRRPTTPPGTENEFVTGGAVADSQNCSWRHGGQL